MAELLLSKVLAIQQHSLERDHLVVRERLANVDQFNAVIITRSYHGDT